ncbi:MAG: MerR family transcriptional regulator [Candidatus Marinimicrobia bacterium]|nr:MerR family transcriptional regulator [Candidatus Neomarinimicrobiota bacterium]
MAIKKLYYSIGEVADMIGVKPHVLRYWESEFSILTPSKNRAGNRIYKEKDVLIVRFIKDLLYNKKFTIEGAKLKLTNLKNHELSDFEKNQALGNQSRKEIDRYKEAVVKIRHGLKDMLDLLDHWEE